MVFQDVRKASKTFRYASGFSLAEVLASVTIGALILVAMLFIYHRADASAASISRNIEESRMPSEILQRIAEDLDRITIFGSNTRITIANKFEEGCPTARMIIRKSFKDKKGVHKEFEEIVWQTNYDYEGDANGLVLYRKHSGIALEDKLLDEKRGDHEKSYPFVPICGGITYFSIQVPKGEEMLNRWPGTTLPRGIVVTISFAEPFETLEGTLDVPEEEKISRTIAVDRTRKVGFKLVKAGEEEEDGGQDPNSVEDANDVEDGSTPEDGGGPEDLDDLKIPDKPMTTPKAKGKKGNDNAD
jgi:hypothetical protein